MPFTFHALDIPAVILIETTRFGDRRGFFSETWSLDAFREGGIDVDFVQDNHSLSAAPGTVRGLHFQTPPYAQDKLVRVTRGAVLDVAVDIRQGSPTFGRWTGAELSAENGRQLFVPAGFAHGFATLMLDTEVQYKVSAPYAPDHDKGMAWNDPALSIDWPVSESEAQLSDKDRRQPLLADLPAWFTWTG